MSRRAHRTATGTVVAHDQGAHLTEWRVGDLPVIWVSARAEYAEGRPIRGGVPVCWPWFGSGRSGDLSPSHGFARTAPWRLVVEESGPDRIRWVWELSSADVIGVPGIEHFPHRFTAQVSVEVSGAASIALTIRNEDRRPFDYEAALHSYLHVGDVRRVTITGLAGAPYLDKVTGSRHTQQGDLGLTGQTDRVYRCAGPVQVHDPVLNRTLTVAKSGSPETVIWNPWDAKAASMSDLGDREWTQLLCVEAAAVGVSAPQLAPGEAQTLSTTITVTPRDAA